MTAERVYFADALRACVLVLVVVVHASIPYTTVGGWPLHDRHTSMAFDLLVLIQHIFSMPVYFVMSGYFAALIVNRRGVTYFVRQRARRIALPMLVALVTILPIIKAVGLYARWSQRPPASRPPFGPLILELFRGDMFRFTNAAHLWFLFDLLWISAMAIVVRAIVIRMAPDLSTRVDRWLTFVSATRWCPIVLGALTVPLLLPMRFWGADHAQGFMSPIRLLIYYAAFFAFGWRLQRLPDVVAALGRPAVAFLIAGGVVSAVYATIVVRADHDSDGWRMAALFAYGWTVWLMVLGLVGWFWAHYSRPHVTIRYVSDASYWIYLVHYPLVGMVQIQLAGLALPAIVKFAAVLTVCLPLLFSSYHTAVRRTFIGRALTGRREPARST